MSIQWQRRDKGFWTCSLNATPFPHSLRARENICGSYTHKIEQRLTERENASVSKCEVVNLVKDRQVAIVLSCNFSVCLRFFSIKFGKKRGVSNILNNLF